MDWKSYISLSAILVSIISFIFSYLLSRKSAIDAITPVLVFEYTQKSGWLLRNVGNGPALNIVFAMKSESSEWFDSVRIPPISRDGVFGLPWIIDLNMRAFGATYEDFQSRRYSTICEDDLSKIFNNCIFDIKGKTIPHWQLAQN